MRSRTAIKVEGIMRERLAGPPVGLVFNGLIGFEIDVALGIGLDEVGGMSPVGILQGPKLG